MNRSVTTFGELSVRYEGEVEPADPGGSAPRRLLALLVSGANASLRVDALIDALWAGRPPRAARKNLQVYVSRLRRLLGDRLTRAHGGYRLRTAADDGDLLRFEQLARDGRRRSREGDPEAAVELLARALELWRERPLAECDDAATPAPARERLQELFLASLEEWADLEAARDGHRRVLDRLQDHVPANLLRERLAAAWIGSLAATGRESEALAHFEAVRRSLARELGVTPGPALTVVHRRLTQRAATPPLRRPGPGNQLPRDLPDFVGRRPEIRDALAHFGAAAAGGSQPRTAAEGAAGGGVMVVSGPVGVGKTAFAVHVGHRLGASFPDGLVMAELGNRPLSGVLRGLLDTVGLPGERGTAQALARWRTWVSERRLLLVLDDAVSGQVARALLPRSGASGTIVTSRYRLSGLEAVARIELPALAEAESTELLGRVIGAERVAADPAAARAVACCCEGLPLALRVAGAKLDALRHVRLADFAARVRAAASPLDEMASGELVLRERYEVFWRDLTEPQRSAYRAVVARRPPYSHEQVAAQAEELLECCLLTPPGAGPRGGAVSYGMSRFAHAFGRERLGAEPYRGPRGGPAS
ncbi:BTAD domain-containing putative transcriptional regulator [Streptomyces sp. V4-01]|uniref:BTAD domain-containing putative transcriptional regulator n=1 Tax=Actinacidiphila polyblastidii TaxID=3110430 RepID=A0ABU7PBZ7_9ACTN|nr:BTAD domain-containing putative transcriptional regulator [Streptomyces sp. V4-01]